MDRRRLIVLWVWLAGCASVAKKSEPAAIAPDDATTYVYAGSAGGDIQVFELDRISGRLTARAAASAGRAVSALAADRQGRFLYAAAESAGEVAAFAIRPKTGALAPLNRVTLRAPGASALALHRNGKYLLATTSDGQVVVFAVRPDGALGPPDPYPSGAGPRAVALNPQLDFAFVLTPAAINQFAFNTGTGILTASREAPVTLPARSQPRRLLFHPSGRFAYVLQEGTGQIAGYSFEPTSGTLSVLAFQTISLTPEGAGEGAAAGKKKAPRPRGGDLEVTARFLYAIDRVHETIATYAIDPESGGLSLVGHQEARGVPRTLAVAEGKLNPLLLAAQQGTLSSFHMDTATGKLAHAETKPLRAPPTALVAATVRPE
jgi:6-phosphogluconolactonase